MLIALVLLDVGSIFALMTTGALERFTNRLPTYQEHLVLLTNEFGTWLDGVGMLNSREAVPDIFDSGQAMAVVRLLLSNASEIFADGLLVLFTVNFILLEAPGLPAKLKAAFKTTEDSDARLGKVMYCVNQYMLIKTLASLATAALIWG